MIKIIWYGTATILLQVDEEKLLFDPFFRLYLLFNLNKQLSF